MVLLVAACCPETGAPCETIADCAAEADCRQVACQQAADGCRVCAYTLTYCTGSTCGAAGCNDGAPCMQPQDPSTVAVCVSGTCMLAPADDPGRCAR